MTHGSGAEMHRAEQEGLMTLQELLDLLHAEDLSGIHESNHLDFKLKLEDSKKGAKEFTRDVVAMANTPRRNDESAYIVFGVGEPSEGPFVIKGPPEAPRRG